MSLSLTSRRIVAPASRHTFANVRSVGSARLFRRPDREQAAPGLRDVEREPHSFQQQREQAWKVRWCSLLACTKTRTVASSPVGLPSDAPRKLC